MASYRLIPLSGKRGTGLFAKVDPEDYEKVAEHSWHLSSDGYAVTKIAGRNTRMHRLILGVSSGVLVDHKYHDKLDNRRKKLRVCSRAQNSYNAKVRVGGASKYKGVKRHAGGDYWRASIAYLGNHLELGTFKDEIEAARAYDAAARYYYGDFANPNFPEETEALSMEAIRDRNEQRRLAETTSMYRGVSWDKARSSWRVCIQAQGKFLQVGRFSDEHEAAVAYNEAALKYHGSKARLNALQLTSQPEPEP